MAKPLGASCNDRHRHRKHGSAAKQGLASQRSRCAASKSAIARHSRSASLPASPSSPHGGRRPRQGSSRIFFANATRSPHCRDLVLSGRLGQRLDVGACRREPPANPYLAAIAIALGTPVLPLMGLSRWTRACSTRRSNSIGRCRRSSGSASVRCQRLPSLRWQCSPRSCFRRKRASARFQLSASVPPSRLARHAFSLCARSCSPRRCEKS
jgi:hypothetical protein